MTTDATLPEPPVPLDCDLRNFPFTPIFRARLFGSGFHAQVTDTAWRAGVTLWLKAWDQVPAGSLPADDVVLCRLAELGRDLKTWAKIKDQAMHGWFKCSDGRLYHNVVAEGINEAWEGKLAQRHRTEAARATRLANRSPQTDVCSYDAPVTGSVTDSNRKGKGERKGNGKGLNYSPPTAEDGGGEKAPTNKPAASKKIVGEPPGFAEFYDQYPRKIARRAAAGKFKEALGRSTLEEIMAGLARYIADRAGKEQQFIAHPATWLNQDRWKDEISPTGPPDAGGFEDAHREGWIERLKVFYGWMENDGTKKGSWLLRWGPPPDQLGSRVPEAAWQAFKVMTPPNGAVRLL